MRKRAAPFAIRRVGELHFLARSFLGKWREQWSWLGHGDGGRGVCIGRGWQRTVDDYAAHTAPQYG